MRYKKLENARWINLKVFFKSKTWESKSGERGITTIEILKTGNVEISGIEF